MSVSIALHKDESIYRSNWIQMHCRQGLIISKGACTKHLLPNYVGI